MLTPTIRLVHKLGEGGMGSVWVAEHLGLRTHVAVKFMAKDLAGDPVSMHRFTQEATAAAQVKSPHIVQMYDNGVTAEGVPYLVMELLSGEDLGRRIQRLGPLPLREAGVIVSQTARALSRAHAAGIIHRDIKPDNIFLVDHDGETFVKLVDFGVAKQGGAMGMTNTGAMVGTPYYMSREQLVSSKHVDHRSDLWSLAVVAYHAVVGQLPWKADSLGGLCIEVDRGTFERPSGLRAGIPTELDAWFQKALAKDIDARFGTAKELADAFSTAVAAAPPQAGAANLDKTTTGFAATLPLPASEAPALAASGPSRPRTLGEASVPPQTLAGASVTQADPMPRKPRTLAIVLVAAAALLVLAGAGALALRGRTSEPAALAEPARAASATVAASATPATAAATTATATPSTVTAPATSAEAPAVARQPPQAAKVAPKKDPPAPAAAPTAPAAPRQKREEPDRGF